MKTIKQMLMATIISLLTVAPALAETGTRQDDSSLLVWAFLGACALIIFLQLVPVISLAIGMIRGLAGSSEDEAEMETVGSKYH